MLQVLALAGSNRAGSLNQKLIEAVAPIARSIPGVTIDVPFFRDFHIPVYDGDLEENVGVPYAVEKLAKRIESASAVILAAPEYNHSVAGPLKNAVDWVSRRKPNPWNDKPVLLISASPSALGGARGLKHLRSCLDACGAKVHLDVFCLPHAESGFNSGGGLRDKARARRLAALVSAFLDKIPVSQGAFKRRSLYLGASASNAA